MRMTATQMCLQIIQGHYQGFVTGATAVIYKDFGQLPSDAQITACLETPL